MPSLSHICTLKLHFTLIFVRKLLIPEDSKYSLYSHFLHMKMRDVSALQQPDISVVSITKIKK